MFSEISAGAQDEEVKRIIRGSHQKAKNILKNRKDKLQKLASLLLEREVMKGEELRKILK